MTTRQKQLRLAKIDALVATVAAATGPGHAVTTEDLSAARALLDELDFWTGVKLPGELSTRYDRATTDARLLVEYDATLARLHSAYGAWITVEHLLSQAAIDAAIAFLGAYGQLDNQYGAQAAPSHGRPWYITRLATDLGRNFDYVLEHIHTQVTEYMATLVSRAPLLWSATQEIRSLVTDKTLRTYGIAPEWPEDYDRWMFQHLEHPQYRDLVFWPWEHEPYRSRDDRSYWLFRRWAARTLASSNTYHARKLVIYLEHEPRFERALPSGMYTQLLVLADQDAEPPDGPF